MTNHPSNQAESTINREEKKFYQRNGYKGNETIKAREDIHGITQPNKLLLQISDKKKIHHILET